MAKTKIKKIKTEKPIPSLKPLFKISLNYLKESEKYIYSSIIIFCIFAAIGFIFHQEFSPYLDKLIQEIIQQTVNLRGLDLIAFIFKNNLISAFYSIFIGIILGIIPLFNALTNGLLLGYVSEKVASSSSILDLWRILPHGIFELPAIFISIGMGLKLGISLFSKSERQKINENLEKSLASFILIIVPLLIIAAIIEGLLITFLS